MPQGRTVRLKETQDPNASGSQPTDLPFQQSIPLDPPSSKQYQEIQDLCRQILMVRISEVHEPRMTPRSVSTSTNTILMISTNIFPTTWKLLPPTVTEAQAATKQDPPAPHLAVTVTVQLEEQHAIEDLYERRCLLNQKRVFRRQRLANYQQEHQGDNYDYSNNDLRNVINIGRDAHNVIISRRKECEEMEAYSPSSNYRILAHASAAFKKRKPASTLHQGKPRTQHHGKASLGGDRIN